MPDFLTRFLRRSSDDQGPAAVRQSHPRLSADAEPAAIYAIGDVHGRLDLLQELEALIFADAASIAGEKWMVTLGDHIDRGPQSSGVLTHLMAPMQTGWQRFSLCGNHELEMLAFLSRPASEAAWFGYGGFETLMSYGIPMGDALAKRSSREQWRQLLDYWVPREHVEWLSALPIALETPRYLFVHAGLVPGRSFADQRDSDLAMFRDDFQADYSEFGKTVVHGHQIRPEPLVTPHRLGLDTGAFATGVLTAARLTPGSEPKIIATAPRRRG